jgi:hypothetical protein
MERFLNGDAQNLARNWSDYLTSKDRGRKAVESYWVLDVNRRETLRALWSNLSAEGPGVALLQPAMSQSAAGG